MKLKDIVFKRSKLIKLQLIKFKVYKQFQDSANKNRVEDYELHFKKVLQVIYKYHYHNKKIFFIGLSQKIKKNYDKLWQNTNHLFIPESTWVKGILSNKVSTFKYLHQQVNTEKNTNLKTLFTVQQKPDLILIFDKEVESEAFQEALTLKIPIIAITNTLKRKEKVLYSIYGNLQFLKKKLSNIYVLLLNSILKKQTK